MANRVRRNVAGPADPATVHAKLNERLAEREPTTAKPAAPMKEAAPTIANAARAIKGRRARIEEALEE